MFSDIPISIKSLKTQNKIKKAMIIDLDVHQGNGHERDKLDGIMGDPNDIFILDGYNRNIYPRDNEAKKGINYKMSYKIGCGGVEFISLLKDALEDSFDEFNPDIIYYNAGTDLLDKDPLGKCCISEEDVILRDEMVFKKAFEKGIPITMVLSGGYQQSNARVIAQSIQNLERKFDMLNMAKDNFSKHFKV